MSFLDEDEEVDGFQWVPTRLIHTRTLELAPKDALRYSRPTGVTYAILSHRWGPEEVSFEEMRTLDKTALRSRKGFSKIEMACDKAAGEGYDYLWVDTCCINKDSSAELTEAINSMYRWYADAAICYAFLSDVHLEPGDFSAKGTKWAKRQNRKRQLNVAEEKIQASEWFRRGWTLQELLAPRIVRFYDFNWTALGTKSSLSVLITESTGIDSEVLDYSVPPADRSIAQRMSWASERKTTRREDQAYCLLGIFDVNMALLYGEGAKAFIRLQEEIIKLSDDQSIFAWPLRHPTQPGLLAESPRAFRGCLNIVSHATTDAQTSHIMTSRGLSIRLALKAVSVDTYIARLNCSEPRNAEDISRPFIGIFLRKLGTDDQYARVSHAGQAITQKPPFYWHPIGENVKSPLLSRFVEVKVPQKPSLADLPVPLFPDRINGFRIATPQVISTDSLRRAYSPFRMQALWAESDNIISLGSEELPFVELTVDSPQHVTRALRLGFTFAHRPICFLATKEGLQSEFWSMWYTSGTLSTDEQIRRMHEMYPLTKDKSLTYMWLKVVPGVYFLEGSKTGIRASIYHLKTELRTSLNPVDMSDTAPLVWDVYLERL